uniref:Uncharacterized protein n=1 Tax=Gasterosteus aculeatus aculeatus TaxID=481459 RepID=A0AAQ4PMZ6_GASAC
SQPRPRAGGGASFCDLAAARHQIASPRFVQSRIIDSELKTDRRPTTSDGAACFSAPESLPQSNTTVIAGAVSGALLLLVLVAVVACVVMRSLHSRHEYEGCTSLESASSPAPKPRKKAESSLEVSRSTGPSGPLQGPVIYAQLDHSGSKHSFHKMEPVVYADIRKN